MTATPAPGDEDAWRAFVAEVGIELANPPGVEGTDGTIKPHAEKTRGGRVMAMPRKPGTEGLA